MIRTGSAVCNFVAKCVREDNRDKILCEYRREKYEASKNAFLSANKKVIDAVMYVKLPKKYEEVQRFLDITLFEKWRRLDVGFLPQLCLVFTRIESALDESPYFSVAEKVAEIYEHDPGVQEKLKVARSAHP